MLSETTLQFPESPLTLEASEKVPFLSARVALLNASFLWTSERGGGGGAGDKLRIAQKRYREKRFFILP